MSNKIVGEGFSHYYTTSYMTTTTHVFLSFKLYHHQLIYADNVRDCCVFSFVTNYSFHCNQDFRLVLVPFVCMQVEWPMKLQIAQGVIHGMNYLHTKNPPVIHADLKIQNVLVGDAYKAKVITVTHICHAICFHSWYCCSLLQFLFLRICKLRFCCLVA